LAFSGLAERSAAEASGERLPCDLTSDFDMARLVLACGGGGEAGAFETRTHTFGILDETWVKQRRTRLDLHYRDNCHGNHHENRLHGHHSQETETTKKQQQLGLAQAAADNNVIGGAAVAAATTAAVAATAAAAATTIGGGLQPPLPPRPILAFQWSSVVLKSVRELEKNGGGCLGMVGPLSLRNATCPSVRALRCERRSVVEPFFF
jgi:hypothetical protein